MYASDINVLCIHNEDKRIAYLLSEAKPVGCALVAAEPPRLPRYRDLYKKYTVSGQWSMLTKKHDDQAIHEDDFFFLDQKQAENLKGKCNPSYSAQPYPGYWANLAGYRYRFAFENETGTLRFMPGYPDMHPYQEKSLY